MRRAVPPAVSSGRLLLRFGCLCAWPVWLGAQSPAGTPALGLATGGDDANWSTVVEAYEDAFVAPTAPVPVERMLLPWEPTEAVVVSLPLRDWEREPGVALTFRELLAALLPTTRVVALYRETDYRLIGDWLLAAEKDPRLSPHLDRLEWVAAEASSIWARDPAPLFARGRDGRLVGIDTSFLASRRMMGLLLRANSEMDPVEQQYGLREATAELRAMRGEDAVSAALMPFIESRLGQKTAMARAPLYLLGGDILLVDPRQALVSAQTLLENGGRTQSVEAVLRDYGAIERVVFLENLPGDTIEHLDFIVQPIAENVILVAAPPAPFAQDRPYHRYVERELRARLERNRAKLEAAFPDARMLALPMPPPLLDTEDAVLRDLLLHCVATIAGQRGLPFWREAGDDEVLDPQRMDPRLVKALQSEFRVLSWDAPLLQRRAVEQFLGRPFEELLRRHVEEHVHFRSYVNSLYVKTRDGAELILVPRYRASTPAEAPLLAAMEAEVEAVLAQALPAAELHWIDCTALTRHLGAVHCLTATIPAGE